MDGGETVDAFQALATLVDQSLVDEWPTPDALADEPRYGMLETIREFATEQLAASGEMIQAERAFEAFLITRAEAAEAGLSGPEQPEWLERLEADHDNLRAALGRALERSDTEVALQLAPRLWQFWWLRGYLGEGTFVAGTGTRGDLVSRCCHCELAPSSDWANSAAILAITRQLQAL